MPGEPGFKIRYGYVETQREDGFTEFEITATGADPTITDSGGLKAQDDRTVTTFPSGLVRIDRTYVCPTASEATFRPQLLKGNQPPSDDFSPAIDGLYIYPDPNEVRRQDGFTEFQVSSYGRINTTGFFRQIGTVVDLGETFRGTAYVTIPVNVQQFVVPYPYDINSIDFFGAFRARKGLVYYAATESYGQEQQRIEYPINGGILDLKFNNVQGQRLQLLPPGFYSFAQTIRVNLGTAAPQTDIVNHGFWDEITINYGY